MSLPDVIPIAYEPDYRTDTIGAYRDGQFFASITATIRDADEANWRHAQRRRYLALHLFDRQGNHRSSNIRPLPAVEFGDEEGFNTQLMVTLLDALPGLRFGDIAIKPFRVDFDGVTFGLIDESGEHGDADWAELYPDRLGFHDPWNGLYDT